MRTGHWLANGAISNIPEERDDLPAKFCRTVDEVGDALGRGARTLFPKKKKMRPVNLQGQASHRRREQVLVWKSTLTPIFLWD
jgi:hypothetical protein